MLLAGCASNPPAPSVNVVGTAAEQQRFAGVWRGHVDATDNRQDADVEFHIQPGSAGPGMFTSTAMPRPVKILWIRLSGNKLSGAVEPYFDDSCSCDAYVTFEGELDASGTMLSGTLRKRERLLWRDAGTWTAQRK